MFNLTNALLGAAWFLLLYLIYHVVRLRSEIASLGYELFDNSMQQNIGLSSYLQQITNTVEFNSLAARHTLNALRPSVVRLMNEAAEREDFQQAQVCKEILQQMDELILRKDQQ